MWETIPRKKLKAASRLNWRTSAIARKRACKKNTCCTGSLKRKKKHKKVINHKKKSDPSAQRGEQGNQGTPGTPGAQGLQGTQGIQGPQGASGAGSISELIILPTAQRYFYSMNADTQSPVKIPAYEFTNDEGTFITEFPGNRPNSYSNLYINGILQEGSLYLLNESALDIIPNKQTIFSGTPIILENVSFAVKIIS